MAAGTRGGLISKQVAGQLLIFALCACLTGALGCGTPPPPPLDPAQEKAAEQEKAVKVFTNLGGIVDFEDSSLGSPARKLDLRQKKVTDADLKELKSLPDLRTLILFDTPITDAGLESVQSLTRLEELNLNSTLITDAGLQNLKGLRKLRDLDVGYTDVTDACLEHLKGLSQLKTLGISHTKVTDAATKKLKKEIPLLDIHR